MSAGVDTSRRFFLRGAVLTREGREEAIRRQRPLGPRPPWLDGRIDPAYCAACDPACVSACEQHIIRIHPSDHHQAGLPWLDFTAGGCTFCADCARACPRVERIVDTPQIGTAQIDTGRCLAWNDVICLSCAGVCRERALRRDRSRRVTVDTLSCTGCGQCVSKCPVMALTITWKTGSE